RQSFGHSFQFHDARTDAVQSAAASARPNVSFVVLQQTENLRMRCFNLFKTRRGVMEQSAVRCANPNAAVAVFQNLCRFRIRPRGLERADFLESDAFFEPKQFRAAANPHAAVTRAGQLHLASFSVRQNMKSSVAKLSDIAALGKPG